MVGKKCYACAMMVFFDLDRTLMDFERAESYGIEAVFSRYSDEISMKYDVFSSAWKKWAQTFFDRYSAGELTFDQQRRLRVAKVFELNGFPIKDDVELEKRFALYWQTYEKEYTLFDDARDVLKILHDREVPMGIITNGDSKNQRAKLKRAGITNLFDPVIVSSEVGFSKPDERIFQKALKEAGCLPQESLYVGDSFDHDIVPARKLGMNCLHLVRGRESPLQIESQQPLFAIVKDFWEVLAIIEKYHCG